MNQCPLPSTYADLRKEEPFMNLPAAVSCLLSMLADAGFSAWVVGGCVRDSLLGRAPNDWDLCTHEEAEALAAGGSARVKR